MISYTKIYLCCTIKRLSRRSEHDLVRKQKTELFRTALEHELQKAHKKVFVSDLSSPIISSSPNPNGALRESRKRISLCVGFKTCNCSWWHLNSTLCERTTQHHTSTVIENEGYFLIYMIHLIQMFTVRITTYREQEMPRFPHRNDNGISAWSIILIKRKSSKANTYSSKYTRNINWIKISRTSCTYR